MKKKLLSLLLTASMGVSLTPTIAFANGTAQQNGSSNTYMVDLKDWKVGVNGATPVDAQIGTTGIILYPGDKLVWTSKGQSITVIYFKREVGCGMQPTSFCRICVL